MKKMARCLNSKLLELCKHSLQLEELNEKVSTYLPTELRAHCHVGSFQRGCLTLITSQPTWATSLRFMLPELRDKLRKDAHLYQLVSIKINIDTTVAPLASLKTKVIQQPISESMRANLLQQHQDVDLYPPLKKALQHLLRKV